MHYAKLFAGWIGREYRHLTAREYRGKSRREPQVMRNNRNNGQRGNGKWEWIECRRCATELFGDDHFCVGCGADRREVGARVVRVWLRKATEYLAYLAAGILVGWIIIPAMPDGWNGWSFGVWIGSLVLWCCRGRIGAALRWLQRKHREDAAAGR